MMQGPEAMVAMVVFGSIGVTAVTLARAYGKRIAGGGASNATIEALKDEVAQLRAEMEDMQSRVEGLDELHNRVDFAERMIGQLKGKPLIGGGAGGAS